ncbi:cation:proton antiporter domain-containing protein [Spirochaeta dissipatitropha]
MSFELLFFAIFAGGWIGGRLFERLRLPAVLGMTLWGIALGLLARYIAIDPWPLGFKEIEPFIKSLALVIILLRAGLGISRSELRTAGLSAGLMAFIPCLFEGITLTLVFMYLFAFPFEVAGLTAFMIAAVSPAVVVPSMLDLKSRGMGARNGVVTTVLAGASVDDVLSITLFTVFLGLATGAGGTGVDSETAGNTLSALSGLPLALIGGLGIGAAAGFLIAWWFKRHHEAIRATEKALLLTASAVFLVQVGDWLHLAALLGVMTLGFVLLERAETAAHEIASKLGKIWIFAQIALFVLIGMSLEVSYALDAGLRALLAIGIGLTARSIGVFLATWPSNMNRRERLFCVIAYTPKATVQAALGGVALAAGLAQGQTILAIAVLSIVITAPLGLIGIRLSGKRLLS